jgi:hypothetical protein
VVVLADGPVLGEPKGEVDFAIPVSGPSGNYSYGNVRDGVYWPVAVKDANGDGQFDPGKGDPFGEYDANGDGHADSIVISGTDRSGIDIVLRSISSVPGNRSTMKCLKSPPQVYPNPISAATTIRFALTLPAHVRLCIYDRLGSQVECLLDQTCMGAQSVSFDAGDLPDGIYFYRMMIGRESYTGNLILCR